MPEFVNSERQIEKMTCSLRPDLRDKLVNIEQMPMQDLMTNQNLEKLSGYNIYTFRLNLATRLAFELVGQAIRILSITNHDGLQKLLKNR